MWPWGHLAVSYLCYVGFLRFQRGREDTQTLLTLCAVGFGSQFPDLVDKPLGWTFGLLPSRSLGHSLIIAVLFLMVIYQISRRYQREDIARAFGIGHITHSLADSGLILIELLQGDPSHLWDATYLVWPLLPVPAPSRDISLLSYLLSVEFTPYVLFQFGLFGLAIAVWIATGVPGLHSVQKRLGRWFTPGCQSD